MDNTKIDLSTANNWNNNPDWATDEEWVRAAANLEAETGVDILIGADLGNNLDIGGKISHGQIDVDRLTVVIQEGFMNLLSQEELTTLIAETNAYIRERVYHLKFVGEAFRNENRFKV
jgi:hypothetical protein